jgi:transcriptional regulator NrdR family protein
MNCPFCHHKTKIYNSRSSHNQTQTWRRHRCTNCSSTFTTREKIDWDGKTTVKTTSAVAPYSREHLLLSLVTASANLSLAAGTLSELTDTIESELQQINFFKESENESDLITTTATTVLARFDRNIALQYVNHVYANKPPIELIKQLAGA